MKAPDLELRDERPIGRRGTRFRRAWTFKGDAIERILPFIEGAPGAVVHACCGASVVPGETLRVDLHHPSADLAIDVADLDKHVQGASVVIMDPPYAMDVAQKQRMVNACMRALRPGGLFILHAPWWPKWRKVADLVEAWIREDANLGWPHPPVVLSIWRKRPLSERQAEGQA